MATEWNKDEKLGLDERISTASEFVKSFATVGIGLTMTNWNNK